MQDQSRIRFYSTVFIFVAGAGLAGAQIFRVYTVQSGYSSPSPVRVIPILAEYLLYALVPTVFFLSLKGRSGWTAAAKILAALCLFVLGYIFVVSFAEWAVAKRDYSFGAAFSFTLYHSWLFTSIIYAVISLVLYFLTTAGKDTDGSAQYLEKISYRDRNETVYIQVSEISRFEANDNYVNVYSDGKAFLIRRTLSSLESELDPQVFQRVHRKHIVDISRVKSYKTDGAGGYVLTMDDGSKVGVSKTNRDKINLIKLN